MTHIRSDITDMRLISHKFSLQRLTLLRQKTRVEGSLEPPPSTNTLPHINEQISLEEIAPPEALNIRSTTLESFLLPTMEDTQCHRKDNAYKRRGYYSTPTPTPKHVPKVCWVYFAPILDEMAVTTTNFFAAIEVDIGWKTTNIVWSKASTKGGNSNLINQTTCIHIFAK
jgi:hypothetical protein